MTRSLLCATILLGLVAGCDTSATEDHLRITFAPYSTPVQIDTFCDNGGCIGEEQITTTIAFDRDADLPEETEVQFEQYRIDYELAEISKKVPYFASPVDLLVYPRHSMSFTVYAAGQIQRDFIYEAVGDTELEGTARLTFAGYDNFDEQVFLEKEFDVGFGDFYTDAEDTSTENTTP